MSLVYSAASPIHGTGAFASADIAEGAFIGVYEGRTTRTNGTYVLWVQDEGGHEWQGIEGSNVLRYLNHSSTPNSEFDGRDLFALRAIGQDEELTIDYGEWFDPDG